MANRSSNYWDRRTIQRLIFSEKQSEVYIKRIKAMYSKAEKNIQGMIDNVYKNYSKETGLDVQVLKELLTKSESKKIWDEMKKQGLDQYVKTNYKSRITRLERLQMQVYAKAKELYNKERLTSTELYKKILKNNYYRGIYDIQTGVGLNFSFAKLDENTIKALLQDNWSGKNYSERIWGNTDILAESLSEELGGAILSGQGIEKTASRIRDRFDVAKYYATRLIRTETNHFHAEADFLAYEEMGIDKYVFVATLDNRTSTICQELDGKIFNVRDKAKGVNCPPMHPNCRSTTRAYVDDMAERRMTRRTRDPVTGETSVIGNKTYKEWQEKYERYSAVENKEKENERRGKDTTAAVNWKVIKDKSYRDKISKISNNERLNNSIYDVSRKILDHRDNTLREDMYLLDYKTGKILASQTHMDKDECVNYNKEIKKVLLQKQKLWKHKKIIAVHNHPRSIPPSDGDINACWNNGYEFGIIIGHDGIVFKYNSKKMSIEMKKDDYKPAVDKYKKLYYNSTYRGQLEALRVLSKKYKFRVEEVVLDEKG